MRYFTVWISLLIVFVFIELRAGLKRCGKSCRLRWLNYLRPNIKHGDFTPEEDSIICGLYISIGSRWNYTPTPVASVLLQLG
jgi:hypothetical protein